jgi:hypothetical protein
VPSAQTADALRLALRRQRQALEAQAPACEGDAMDARIAEKLDGPQVRVISVGRPRRAAAFLAMYIAPWLLTWVTMIETSHR